MRTNWVAFFILLDAHSPITCTLALRTEPASLFKITRFSKANLFDHNKSAGFPLVPTIWLESS